MPTQLTGYHTVIVCQTSRSDGSKGPSVKKREVRKDTQLTEVAEESEYQEGVLVQYYDYGYRYGHILETVVDDDGDLYCKVQPISGKFAAVKPRALGYKSTDLKIE